eukprot:CAMPEP_0196574092 /NCGR_PEP_ID=MMETSP1081-20130531/3870_1 /TAXON_ID=36882 /ORGANISM="Pyramimonas amylifera, Strain CCMP720" /LENGTH=197 /DNA_ID=CAMNT_0041891997 /DNA_START=34 /DNA_END=628 /DNA_ORIENTATION=+
MPGGEGIQPIYCGNFEYDLHMREIERMFDQYGRVDHIAMKTGFAFVYMEDERDGNDAIRDLNGKQVGRRALKVQWAKGAGPTKAKEDKRFDQSKPTDTLFICNFDQRITRYSDLESHFSGFGRVMRVHMKRNFAFMEFDSVGAAQAALEARDQTRMGQAVITVQYNVEEAGGGGMVAVKAEAEEEALLVAAPARQGD